MPRSDCRSLILISRIARETMEVVSKACDVSLFELSDRRRSRAHVAFARQVAMYLCHVVGQLSLSEISQIFGRDKTTVAHACHAIEDRRESPIFNVQIESLEERLFRRVNGLYVRHHLKAVVTEWDLISARRALGGKSN